MVLNVPTLAERIDDVPMLVEHFVARARPGRGTIVTRGAMQMLQERPWPGNVRELKQTVESALAFSRESLDVEALGIVLTQRSRMSGDQPPGAEFVERQRLLKLLTGAAWDTERAARSLGVHRTTIYRRMRRLGIAAPSSGAGDDITSRFGNESPCVSTLAGVSAASQVHRANGANANL
jgi:two-component system, NtrC family, response regulator HydG